MLNTDSMKEFLYGVSLLAVPIFILFALVPQFIRRCIVALVRKQWRTSLLALSAIALPFAALAVMPALLASIWMGWEVDAKLRSAVVAQVMPGVTNSAAFGLLLGMLSWPWIAQLEERWDSSGRRKLDRRIRRLPSCR